MRTPATNFEALLGQARDCGLTLEFATAYEINVALDEADCCGGGGGGLPEQSKSTTYTDNGRYTVNPDEGYTLSTVNITVDVDQNLTVISELLLEVAQLEGEIATITSLNISENGTFTPPAGILGYNSIDVNVAGGGGTAGKLVLPRGTKLANSDWNYLPEEFDFSNQVDNDCIGMFEDCALREFTWPDTLPTKTVFMQSMFYDCPNLTSVSIPALAWSLVQRTDNMFVYCTSLTEINIPTAPYLHTINGMFSTCRALTQIIFPADINEHYNSPINCDYAFYQCQNVKTISFPETATLDISGYSQTFGNCSKLENLIISHIGAGAISYAGFDTCTSLTLSSLQNILNALPTTTSGYKCTIGTTNLAKLSETDIQIATDKGWTLN